MQQLPTNLNNKAGGTSIWSRYQKSGTPVNVTVLEFFYENKNVNI